YAAMLLPVAMLGWKSRATLLLQVQAIFISVAYANGPGREPFSSIGQFLERSSTRINFVLLLFLLIWARPSEQTEDPRIYFDEDSQDCSASTQRSKEASSD
ncbi:MAG: hypothetical protein WD029_04890, partial [Microthrixaceae bacterium]